MTDRGNLARSGEKVLTPRPSVGLPGQNMTMDGMSSMHARTTPRGQNRNIKDMTIEEMESALTKAQRRNVPEQARSSNGPQTARALLEENKILINEKQERKALEKKNSREFVAALLAQDQMTIESDKAREIGRRGAKQELARYYKAKIAEKETKKSNEYSEKVQSGVEIQYFPFVEGENITKSRENHLAKMREEMRGFLQKQREDHPPRMDSLLADTNMQHAFEYKTQPVATSGRQDLGILPGGGEGGGTLAGDEVAPHMARYPRFLSRAREHMSRRLHDVHVRKALEDKVLQTKNELERLASKRGGEQSQWEDGMLVNDALRYDRSQSKAADRKRNAQFLEQQITDRKSITDKDKQDRNGETAGYWGPEEKERQGPEVNTQHCVDLINQMEVNQHRRLDSRNRRLRQERRLIDNACAEMSEDRHRERHKFMQHREVLTTTWKSQQKIKQAISTVEGL